MKAEHTARLFCVCKQPDKRGVLIASVRDDNAIILFCGDTRPSEYRQTPLP